MARKVNTPKTEENTELWNGQCCPSCKNNGAKKICRCCKHLHKNGTEDNFEILLCGTEESFENLFEDDPEIISM